MRKVPRETPVPGLDGRIEKEPVDPSEIGFMKDGRIEKRASSQKGKEQNRATLAERLGRCFEKAHRQDPFGRGGHGRPKRWRPLAPNRIRIASRGSLIFKYDRSEPQEGPSFRILGSHAERPGLERRDRGGLSRVSLSGDGKYNCFRGMKPFFAKDPEGPGGEAFRGLWIFR